MPKCRFFPKEGFNFCGEARRASREKANPGRAFPKFAEEFRPLAPSTLKRATPVAAERPDQEILERLQAGDEAGMEMLFRQYYGYLCRVVVRVLGDEHLAEDLVQEVFFEVWKKRAHLQVNLSLRGYLRRAAVNRTLNFLRDQKVDTRTSDPVPELGGNLPGSVQLLEARETERLIERAVQALPPRTRLVFVLSRYEDLSNQQIAEELGISPKTVENQMTRALKILREALHPLLNTRR